MNSDNSVIIYRSQREKDIDQYWTEHPEQVIWLFLVCVFVGLILFFFNLYKKR